MHPLLKDLPSGEYDQSQDESLWVDVHHVKPQLYVDYPAGNYGIFQHGGLFSQPNSILLSQYTDVESHKFPVLETLYSPVKMEDQFIDQPLIFGDGLVSPMRNGHAYYDQQYLETPTANAPIVSSPFQFTTRPVEFWNPFLTLEESNIQLPSLSPHTVQATFDSSALPVSSFCGETSQPCRSPPDSETNHLLRRQQPRFQGDKYTPTWTQGDGARRAGWCGYCASWHTLKDSAFWYHMHYQHGIACSTGQSLQKPTQLRQVGMGSDREALCGGCGKWIFLFGDRGRTAWFRHAYKCQLKRSSPAAGLEGARSRTKSTSPRKRHARLSV